MGWRNLVDEPFGNSWSPWNWSQKDFDQTLGINSGDPTNSDRTALRNNSAASSAFANSMQNGYRANGQALNQTLGGLGQSQNYLADQMKGGHSVSMLQMQQGIGNAMAQQRGQAAAAGPQNAAMAQRSAANGMAGAGGQMMNQQAQAGLAERGQAGGALNQSQGSITRMLEGTRGQDVNAANGAYAGAGAAYGQAMATPQKNGGNMFGGGAGGAMGGLASAFSDERLKKNIKAGEDDAKKTLSKLNGTDAKSLSGAGLSHVVKGDQVDTGRLSLSNTAMLASLHKRLSKMEGR